MDDLKLIDITSSNWEKICSLDPGEAGRAFVASNAFSIAQSVYEKGWVIKGIAKGDSLMGFAMYGFSEALKAYELCRFMIDQHAQGNGYGKRALHIILDEMCDRYPCDKIYLSTAPANSRGKHIYKNAGFVPTGETCGEGDDLEDLFCFVCQRQ